MLGRHRPDDTLPELSWGMLENSYPRYPKFGDIEGMIKAEDLHCLMDIAAYVQIGPHSINGKRVRGALHFADGNHKRCKSSP